MPDAVDFSPLLMSLSMRIFTRFAAHAEMLMPRLAPLLFRMPRRSRHTYADTIARALRPLCLMFFFIAIDVTEAHDGAIDAFDAADATRCHLRHAAASPC